MGLIVGHIELITDPPLELVQQLLHLRLQIGRQGRLFIFAQRLAQLPGEIDILFLRGLRLYHPEHGPLLASRSRMLLPLWPIRTSLDLRQVLLGHRMFRILTEDPLETVSGLLQHPLLQIKLGLLQLLRHRLRPDELTRRWRWVELRCDRLGALQGIELDRGRPDGLLRWALLPDGDIHLQHAWSHPLLPLLGDFLDHPSWRSIEPSPDFLDRGEGLRLLPHFRGPRKDLQGGSLLDESLRSGYRLRVIFPSGESRRQRFLQLRLRHGGVEGGKPLSQKGRLGTPTLRLQELHRLLVNLSEIVGVPRRDEAILQGLEFGQGLVQPPGLLAEAPNLAEGWRMSRFYQDHLPIYLQGPEHIPAPDGLIGQYLELELGLRGQPLLGIHLS